LRRNTPSTPWKPLDAAVTAEDGAANLQVSSEFSLDSLMRSGIFMITMMCHTNHLLWPTPADIAEFSYSKLSHFDLFHGLPFQSWNVGDPDPAICDLKVYQDYLTYCFIRRNVPPGSRILDVGGGDSRVLKFFSGEYECWNADKCEGLGNGPVNFCSPHYRIVYDYVGSFSPELPDHYFDFVFSVSALEHTPEDETVHSNVLKDINRILKPGAPSLHCFDVFLRPGGQSYACGLIAYLYANAPLQTRFVPLAEIEADPNTYTMSQEAYEAQWRAITKISYSDLGRPCSLNLFWTGDESE
jgi:ubiquinone/menaquinone biosynthesis C-methylase UbiE